MSTLNNNNNHNKLLPRNKSSDKINSNPFIHFSNISTQKPPSSQMFISNNNNIPKHQSKKIIKKSNQYQFSGELNFDHKPQSHNNNINIIHNKHPQNKNNSSIGLSNSTKIFSKKKSNRPKKSPIPISRSIFTKNNNNPFFSNNNFFYNNNNNKNNYHSSNVNWNDFGRFNFINKNLSSSNCRSNLHNSSSNNNKNHTNDNRTKSPSVRTREHTPKPSPGSRPRSTSKTPVINFADIFKNYSKYNFLDKFDHYKKNTRPKSSNVLDKNIHKKNKDDHHTLQDSRGNISDRDNKMSINLSKKGNNNNNINATNNVNVLKPHLINKKNKNKGFNNNNIQIIKNNNSHNESNNSNNYYIQDNNNNNKVQNVSPQDGIEQQQINPNKGNNTTTLKKNNQKVRSNSTSTPHALQEIVQSKNTSIASQQQNEQQLQCNKKFQKTIRQIYQFTHVGFDGEIDKENNQDREFVETNFAGRENYVYMSVCDGHGIEGHKVSQFIKQILPKIMTETLKHKELEDPTPQQKVEAYTLIKDVFIESNRLLCENEEINSAFSGSTCVSVIYTPTKLICANIGDSRAVISRYNAQSKKWSSFDLTRDHKPTEPDEAERIRNNGGRIQPFTDEDTGEPIGPQRVWIMDDDVPGLAMTRSFGDIVASYVGVNSEPEITEYTLTEDDKFMLIASDGVWEFIPSEECMKMIREFYEKNDFEGCCTKLYLESKTRWMKEEEVVDDITMVLVFFN